LDLAFRLDYKGDESDNNALRAVNERSLRTHLPKQSGAV